MKALIACEVSGNVRNAFLEEGYDAISCDLLPSDQPGPHYIGDIRDILYSEKWDLLICHPPCTFLSSAGNRFLKNPERIKAREEAYKFCMELMNSPIPYIAMENPVGYLNTAYRKPNQIIQPYQFGHPVVKTTCLWLKNLPILEYTNLLERPEKNKRWSNGKTAQWCEMVTGTKDQKAKIRSRTFEGIARAMAEQWGSFRGYCN